MNLDSKEIINLPVETQSGKKLGRVTHYIIESESQSVTKYFIKAPNLKISNLFGDELMIDRGQVVSLSQKKMIVDDNIRTVKQKKEIIKQTSSLNVPAV